MGVSNENLYSPIMVDNNIQTITNDDYLVFVTTASAKRLSSVCTVYLAKTYF